MVAHEPVMAKAVRKQPAAIWKEAHHFNPWLAGEEGRAALGDTLPGKWRLVSADHQQVAGNLFVDVLGKTALGQTLIVEAQLGQSNHDHLGKLVTYAAIYDAAAAVWIVNDARAEHQEAVNFLNQNATTEFFLVKLEAVVIGTSPPAPLLTLISGPTLEFKKVGQVKAEMKQRDALRLAFWEAFLPEAAAVHPRFAARKARPTNRMTVTSGRLGIRYTVALRQHSCSAELVVLPGPKGAYGDPAIVMKELETSTADIEAKLHHKAEWLYGIRPRLRITDAKGGYENEDKWPEIRREVLSALKDLITATSDALSKLSSRPPLGAGASEEEEEEEDEAAGDEV